MCRSPIGPGSRHGGFRLGLLRTPTTTLAALGLAFTPFAAVAAVAAVPLVLAGLSFYEHAFIRAAQLPPLS